MQSTEVDWLVPHQANIRIMQGTAKKMGLPLEKMVVTVAEHGNTSAASIPLALDQAVRDGRIQPGHTVMMEGVGGGFLGRRAGAHLKRAGGLPCRLSFTGFIDFLHFCIQFT
jgi:3-oxoacyl-[acyl-carrier-protein] synthase III